MGVGKMGQWLGALTAFPADADPIPTTHTAAHIICQDSSKDSDALI